MIQFVDFSRNSHGFRFSSIEIESYLESLRFHLGHLLVSSVNSFIVDCISVTMSLIKIIKKRGPSIESWWTPALISRYWELELFITTVTLFSIR
jgi:hypothetical protein